MLDWSKTLETTADRITYRVEFMVVNFGVPGAITVNNKYQEEFFLESITFEGLVHFACNSWVQPEKVNTKKRIFFANKVKLITSFRVQRIITQSSSSFYYENR